MNIHIKYLISIISVYLHKKRTLAACSVWDNLLNSVFKINLPVADAGCGVRGCGVIYELFTSTLTYFALVALCLSTPYTIHFYDLSCKWRKYLLQVYKNPYWNVSSSSGTFFSKLKNYMFNLSHSIYKLLWHDRHKIVFKNFVLNKNPLCL